MRTVDENTSLTFQGRFRPIKIGRVAKILAIKVDTLSESEKLAKLLDKRLAAKTGLARLAEGVREKRDTLEEYFEG